MSAHAMLGASGAYRWMHCTPSARLEATLPDTSSGDAAEGTAAHALAEYELSTALRKAGYDTDLHKLKKEDPEHPYTKVMREHVDGYTQQIMEIAAAYKNPMVLLEQRLDYSEWVPGGFGTGDVVILADGIVHIVDLKYGVGVPVSADDNPQLKLYALGAVSTYRGIWQFDTVRATIIQPRLDSTSTYECAAKDLTEWADRVVRPVAKKAWNGEGDFVPGDWCRFCRAACDCKARAEKQLQIARTEFMDDALLSPADVSAIYEDVERYRKWADKFLKDVSRRAISEGVVYPGYKVVEGRSDRYYADPEAIEKTLTKNGYSPDDIRKSSLIGITAMEKLLGGKRKLNELIGCYIEKPPGKPTLVPESDKRPAIDPLAQARAEFETEEDN